MPRDALTSLSAMIAATRAYQAALQPHALAQAAPSPQSPQSLPALDAEALGRLAAPVVSRLIARDIRERGDLS